MNATQKQQADQLRTFQAGNFGDLLNGLIEKKLDKQDRDILSDIASDYGKSLTFSRNNDLDQAYLYLNNADREQTKFQGFSLLNQILDLHGLPVKAYFYYKKNDYALAEQYLYEAIQSSSSLVEDGFYMVECHRIQQLHNLARMYFKRKKFKHAGWIISEALLYMTCERIPAICSIWNVKALQENPISLRSDMILQLALETAGELLPPTHQQPEMYQSIFGNWSEPLPGLEMCEPLNQWVKLKNLFIMGDSEESCVEAAIDFVLTTPNRFDILKLDLIVNITDILRKTFNYNAGIYEDLYSFSQKLKVSERYKSACFAYLKP